MLLPGTRSCSHRAGLLRAMGHVSLRDPGPDGASFRYKKAMGSERKSGGRAEPPVTLGRISGAPLMAAAVLVTAGRAGGRQSAASLAPHGAWLVHYEIGGQQLTDYAAAVG